jgi:hypothetical protein
VNSSAPEEVDAEHSLMSVYRHLVKTFNWNLKDIDETNLETLVDFLFFTTNDPNVKIINGKEYHRVKKAPTWL